jgi:hypothetical protein
MTVKQSPGLFSDVTELQISSVLIGRGATAAVAAGLLLFEWVELVAGGAA